MAEMVGAQSGAATLGMADGSGLRVALSPYLFRGMMVGMAGVAVAIHRTTGSQELAWQFAKGRARDLCDLLGLEITLTGVEHLAQGGPFVFAPNHQSHLDILSLLGFLPGRTRFATKSGLWKHPVVGAVLDTLGMIPIDRERPELAIEHLNRQAGGNDRVVRSTLGLRVDRKSCRGAGLGGPGAGGATVAASRVGGVAKTGQSMAKPPKSSRETGRRTEQPGRTHLG